MQRALGEWLTAGDELFFEALDRANAIRMSILQAEVIAYEIDADADDDNVIEIFARLNQQGVRLRPGDLAAARLTGQMANFRVRAREALVMKELRGFSAPEGAEESSRGGAFVDTDLLIRAALFLGGGGVRYRDAEKRKIQAHYQNIEASWDGAVAGFKSAVALFRNAGVPSGDWLPYRYLLFPPAIAAARGHALDERWTGWALAASLWRHYAGEVDTKLAKDAALAETGRHRRSRSSTSSCARSGPRARSPRTTICCTTSSARTRSCSRCSRTSRASTRGRSPAASCSAARTSRWRCTRSSRAPSLDRYPRPRQRIRARPARQPDAAGPLRQRAHRRDRARRLPAHHRPARSLRAPDSDDRGLWTVTRYNQFCEQRERGLASMLRDLLYSYGVT